jgi:hypothetical protein
VIIGLVLDYQWLRRRRQRKVDASIAATVSKARDEPGTTTSTPAADDAKVISGRKRKEKLAEGRSTPTAPLSTGGPDDTTAGPSPTRSRDDCG